MRCASGITGLGLATVVVLLIAGCSDLGSKSGSGADDESRSVTARPSAPAFGELAEVGLPVAAGADVDGLVKVDGHDLAVHCTGSGAPTVVILHGWIDEPNVTSHQYYGRLTSELKPDFRVCDYDRANVGDSETVAGTQTPEMVVGDLDGLMRAIGDNGPYVLVGQSAGGMIASAYAVAHPEKVAGIVMVDASFDEEVTIEDVGMVPDGAGPCDPVNRELDGQQSLQKIDNCTMYKWAYDRRDQRPQVPLVYLAAKRADWNHETAFGPTWPAAFVALIESYAAGWSPGKVEWVDSGHEIHVERPDVVGDAVRWVVDQGGQ